MLASFVVIKFKASIENSENVLLWFLLVTQAILIFFVNVKHVSFPMV